MAERTAIEWTDATWNPITGCSVISPGCTNCYAMRLAGTRLRYHPSRAGLTRDTKTGPVWTGDVRFNEQWLTQPLSWRDPKRIFVCAHGDLFHPRVPDEWIDRVFAVMALAPQHTFQVLTKRDERMRRYVDDQDLTHRISAALGCMLDGDWIWDNGRLRERIERLIGVFIGEATDEQGDVVRYDDPMPLPNVWLGVSVEDQRAADQRRESLAALAAAGWRTWVSYEPALGPVDWRGWKFIRWLVAGGESGPGARPSHPDWHRAARDFCVPRGIAFHFKQWGEWAPGDAFGLVEDRPITNRTGDVNDWMRRYVICSDRADRLAAHSFTKHATNLVYRVGKRRAGAVLDGREWREMPA